MNHSNKYENKQEQEGFIYYKKKKKKHKHKNKPSMPILYFSYLI